MATTTVEKSILLHTYRDDDTEAWFEIKLTGGGATVAEIFKNLPKTHHKFRKSNCALIGSSLYVLGGRATTGGPHYRTYSNVRCLDIENPDNGWKVCKPLPMPSADATVCVAGNLIYLFPNYVYRKSSRGGFYYDTSEQKGHLMATPPGTGKFGRRDWRASLCIASDNGKENSRVLIPCHNSQYLNLYNPDQDSWTEVTNLKLPLDMSHPESWYTIFNGVLYLSYRRQRDNPNIYYLYAYKIDSGKFLFHVDLPFEIINGYSNYNMFLVAIADYKLCYLWCGGSNRQNNSIKVHLATVVVSPDGSSATVVFLKTLDVNARGIESCIPFLDEEVVRETVEITEVDSLNEETVGESVEITEDEKSLQMCDCCNKLKDENRRLMEENKRLLEEVKKFAETDRIASGLI